MEKFLIFFIAIFGFISCSEQEQRNDEEIILENKKLLKDSQQIIETNKQLIVLNEELRSILDTGCFSSGREKFKWSMVTTWPKNFPGLGMAGENFSTYVDEMTCGRVEIKVYGAGELVPAMGVFDAVSQGNVQLGHGASYYWTGKVKSSQFFTAVPFGLTAQEMNGWLHYGGGLELWQEAYEPFNLVPLAGGNTGVQMAGWFNKEINSMEDLKGIKMRIPGLAGEIFTRAGGETVQLPGNEIFLALQQGVVDAAEWVGPYNDLTFGFHQVAKYYYYPGWHEPGSTLEIIINKDALMSLPEDLQAIMKYAAKAANQEMLDEYTARNNQALTELIEKHDVKLRKLPDEVLIALRDISEEVMIDFIEGDEMATRVYNSYVAFKDQVISYHRISEKAYIDTRELD